MNNNVREVPIDELKGPLLDWAVAGAMGHEVIYLGGSKVLHKAKRHNDGQHVTYQPMQDYALLGEMVASRVTELACHGIMWRAEAERRVDGALNRAYGFSINAKAEAICLAVVATAYGATAEVPEALWEATHGE